MTASAQRTSACLGWTYSRRIRTHSGFFSPESSSRRIRIFARACTAPTAAASASFSVAPLVQEKMTSTLTGDIFSSSQVEQQEFAAASPEYEFLFFAYRDAITLGKILPVERDV